MSDKPAEDAASPKPDATPAAKEEIATDVSEVARARLSGTDKTQTAGSVASDAVDAAPGIAGTPPDDGSAPEVEAAPTAVIGKDHPGPGARGEVGPGAPTPTPPAGAAGAPPPMTSTGGGSQSAPLETNPAGTGAPTVPPTPSSVQTPATPAQGAPSGPPATAAPATPAATPPTAAAAEKPAAGPPSPDAPSEKAASADTPADAAARGAIREGAADPDKTAAAPTAPDAAATAAGAAAATAEAEEKPAAPAKPAPAARPAAAAKPGAKPAAPPKPPEPDPEEVTDLRALVPDLTWERRHGYIEVKIPSGQLLPVARMVRDLGYDYLSAVTAVDWRDRLEMLYHCYGWDYVHTPGCVVIRADLPPEANPLCPSLTAVWPGAEFQEREIYDLFGVKFVGHPDLRRILLDDNFPGHPLRKDWTFDYEYVLVRHLKYGAEGQDAPPGGEEGFRRV